MSTVPYAPRGDSVAGRVISFFRSNMDEFLDIEDIVNKFDAARGNVHTLLGGATAAQLLVRDRDADGDYIYKAGPALQPAPADATPAAQPRKRPARTWSTAAVDLANVTLETNVPVPLKRGEKRDYAVGTSAELPGHYLSTLKSAVTAIHKTDNRRFAVRQNKPAGTLRVWRLE